MEWKSPNSPIRMDIESNIESILLDITDEGYRTLTLNWIHPNQSPYVWIANKLNGVNRDFVDMGFLIPFLERLERYFDQSGYLTSLEILVNKKRQPQELCLYFRKK